MSMMMSASASVGSVSGGRGVVHREVHPGGRELFRSSGRGKFRVRREGHERRPVFQPLLPQKLPVIGRDGEVQTAVAVHAEVRDVRAEGHGSFFGFSRNKSAGIVPFIAYRYHRTPRCQERAEKMTPAFSRQK